MLKLRIVIINNEQIRGLKKLIDIKKFEFKTLNTDKEFNTPNHFPDNSFIQEIGISLGIIVWKNVSGSQGETYVLNKF